MSVSRPLAGLKPSGLETNCRAAGRRVFAKIIDCRKRMTRRELDDWRRRISEAQGRGREAGSKGSVEQNRGPMQRLPALNQSRHLRASHIRI
jgi:hypothetical protein